MSTKKFSYGKNFQLDLLKMNVENISFHLLCKKLVKPDFFPDERIKKFYESLFPYYEKYKRMPNRTYFEGICQDKLDRVYMKKFLSTERVVDGEFIRDRLEEFVKKSMFTEAYVEAGKIYNKNPNNPDKAFDYMMEEMKKINNVSTKTDIYHFYFKDAQKRYHEREARLLTGEEFQVPTGIKAFDRITKGGPRGGQVWMALGDAKSGKSLMLIQMGLHAVKRFIPVLHFQLEGKVTETYDRYDANYFSIPYNQVIENNIPSDTLQQIYRIGRKRKNKDLVIRGYTEWESCSVADIEREYLDFLSRGMRFKVVIIDYMDLMRARKNGVEERFRQQSIIRDLKTFAVKYNVLVWTATQSNRISEEEKNDPLFFLTSKNLAEDYGKIRAVDGLITINCTKDEYEVGQARLWIGETRSSAGNSYINIRRALDKSTFYVPRNKYVAFGFEDKKLRTPGKKEALLAKKKRDEQMLAIRRYGKK